MPYAAFPQSGSDTPLERPTPLEQRESLQNLLRHFDNPAHQGPHLTAELEGRLVDRPLQESEDMDELRAIASRVKEGHNEITRRVARRSGGRFFQARHLKNEGRMWEKFGEYVQEGGDQNMILDVVRSRIHFDTLDQLYAAVQVLHESAEVVRVKDHFIHPHDSGYRDILFNVRLRDPATGKTHVTEIQFHLKELFAAKRLEYPHYIKRRELLPELNYYKEQAPENVKKIKELEQAVAWELNASQRIYDEAWQAYLRRHGQSALAA